LEIIERKKSKRIKNNGNNKRGEKRNQIREFRT